MVLHVRTARAFRLFTLIRSQHDRESALDVLRLLLDLRHNFLSTHSLLL